MEITNVKIFQAKKRGPVLAYANVILDNQFIIRGITLLEKGDKKFISMPSRRIKGAERHYRDMAHPLNSDVREGLTDIVFDAYEEFLKAEKE